MRKSLVLVGACGVAVFAITMFAASQALAQTGGPAPSPVYTCDYCHPNYPNICSSRMCSEQDEDGYFYCGCLGEHGINSNGQPWAKPVCGYHPDDCSE